VANWCVTAIISIESQTIKFPKKEEADLPLRTGLRLHGISKASSYKREAKYCETDISVLSRIGN